MKNHPDTPALRSAYAFGAFSPRLFLVVGCLFLAVGLRAQTTIALTAAFDGYATSSGGNSTATTITVGESANKKAGLLMFDLSSLLSEYSSDQIVSATLSYYVTGAVANAAVDISHTGDKDSLDLTGVWTSTGAVGTPSGTTWVSVGRFSKGSGEVDADVTSFVTADLAAAAGESVAYTSFRLISPLAYSGTNSAVTIASSENTTHLVPTLTITLSQIPEPASVPLLAGVGVLMCAVLRLRQRRRS